MEDNGNVAIFSIIVCLVIPSLFLITLSTTIVLVRRLRATKNRTNALHATISELENKVIDLKHNEGNEAVLTLESSVEELKTTIGKLRSEHKIKIVEREEALQILKAKHNAEIQELRKRRQELLERHQAEIADTHKQHKAEIDRLKAHVEGKVRNLQEIHNAETAAIKIDYQAKVAYLPIKFERERLDEWLSEVATAQYRNEIEVEVKFIYLLLKFLGYRDDQITLRESVRELFGRQEFVGETDWTIYATDSKPVLIIEAKAPLVKLNQSVEKQARSYAFALNAPLYMITNGQELRVFERGIQSDQCILDISVEDIPHEWNVISEVLSVDRW